MPALLHTQARQSTLLRLLLQECCQLPDVSKQKESVRVIACFCRGGDKSARTIWDMGWRPGLRSDYTAYATSHPWYLLDWNFSKNTGWVRHERLAKKLRPTIVLIPDYFDKRELPTRLLQHEMIAKLGLGTIWCPKFVGAVVDIPEQSVIGISMPADTYASFLPAPREVSGRKLHLLGGNPDHQLYTSKYLYPESEVISFDGNVLSRKAVVGMYWSKDGRWVQTKRREYSNLELAVMSAQNILWYMKQDLAKSDFNKKRVAKLLKQFKTTA